MRSDQRRRRRRRKIKWLCFKSVVKKFWCEEVWRCYLRCIAVSSNTMTFKSLACRCLSKAPLGLCWYLSWLDRCSDQTQASVGFEVQQEIKTTRKSFNPRKKSRFILQLKRNILNLLMARKPVLELNNKKKKSGSVQVSWRNSRNQVFLPKILLLPKFGLNLLPSINIS
jgi:hypothetical protein